MKNRLNYKNRDSRKDLMIEKLQRLKEYKKKMKHPLFK